MVILYKVTARFVHICAQPPHVRTHTFALQWKDALRRPVLCNASTSRDCTVVDRARTHIQADVSMKLPDFVLLLLYYGITFDRCDLVSVKFVQKDNGKDLALLNGYTFYCHKVLARSTIWSCTRGTGRCKARLILTNDYKITRASLEHSHKAPSYIIRDGRYFKI